MNKLIGQFLLAAVLLVGITAVSHAADEMAAPGPQSVKGDLLKIEGDFYVVQTITGKEVRVHVDKTTKLDGAFKTGEELEVQMTDKGHAFSIKHANAASGGMAAPGSQTVKGDLLKIEGESYVVHDLKGKEVRLHVDQTTKLEGGAFKTGDKVEAQVTEKGHAVSMAHANPAQ
jgi:NMD protein affecting ribosome stability and mRNA decay